MAAVSDHSDQSSARRILITTRNLPPLTGGMERLNWHLAHELSQCCEVGLCGPHGSRELSPAQAPVLKTFASQPLLRFMLESLAATLITAWRFRPALVIAGSGVTAPHAWLAGRLTGARMLVYLHGLDLIAEHPLYRTFFLPSIRRADQVLVNSHNTARLARAAGVLPQRIDILHPGVTLPPKPDRRRSDDFRRMIDAKQRPILLSVGRLTPRKGLLEFIRHALPTIVAAQPDALLVVIGGEASQKLGASDSARQTEAIRRAAEGLGLAGHLRLLGYVDDERLEQAYQASRVHLFPVLDIPGDVEGFGMVAVEAAAHGLVTVAFKAGGVCDAVAQDVSGILIPTGDYTGFAKAVIALLAADQTQHQVDQCRHFASRFSWERFGEHARRICNDLLQQRR